MSGSGDRLPRLLALVPYLLAHPDARIDDVAREFEITERELRDDLNLIFVCGLPGHTPGDLIEVQIVDERITLTNADVLARPLRLSAEEGLALVVALRTMVGLPGVGDPVRRALAKLEHAVEHSDGEAVQIVVEDENVVLETVTSALQAGRRLHLSYYVPGRDEMTERDVDPIHLTTVDGRYYLEGYCRSVRDVRVFRLDRVGEARVLDLAAEVPAEVVPRDLAAGVYQPGPDDVVVRLELDPPARWVADYYPCESVTEGAGGLQVALRTGDTGWLVRLALGLGGTARILEPAELADRVRESAAAALAGYDESRKPGPLPKV